MESKVTIAVALYNNALYIERCMESIINQTYHNLEVIVVDDGSTDDSVEKCKKYTLDQRVRICEKENGGLSSVRQMALDLAEGEFICFIDADDYLNADHVNNLYKQIVNQHADVCICSTTFVDYNGVILAKQTDAFRYDDSSEGFKLTNSIYADAINNSKDRFTLSDSWNKMYRVGFLRKTKVRFILPKGYNGTDSIFNQKIAYHEPIYANIAYSGYVHVMYKSSATHRKNKRMQEGFMIQILQQIEECKKIGIQELMQNRLKYTYYSYLLRSFEDIFQEENSVISQYRKFKEMRLIHEKFMHDYPILKMGQLKNRSYRIFEQLLNKYMFLVPILLKYRAIRS